MGKRVAVAGKGGTGKSTLAALLVAHLARNNRGPVLAIDADPDSNLGFLLGREPAQTVGELREEVLAQIRDLPAGMSKANYVEAGLHQIIEEEKGFDLITMGRGEGPGCYCYLNSLIRKFSDDLFPSYAWIVIDHEAGLEHISRRTTTPLDALVVLINENKSSMRTAFQIEKISKQLKNSVHKVYAVLNMVHEENRESLLQQLSSSSMEHLCDLPFDQDLYDLSIKGRSIHEIDGTQIQEQIRLIIERIGGGNGST
jgi:CO dehydrogenase maturation factor